MVENLKKAQNLVEFVRVFLHTVQIEGDELKFLRAQMLSKLKHVRKDLYLQFGDIISSGETDTYLDKVECEMKKLFSHKSKELKDNKLRQLTAGDKQDESDDQSEN